MKRIITVFFVLATLVLNAQKSVLLRSSYNSGDKYVVAVETVNNMGVQGGMNMKMTMDMLFTGVEADTILSESKITSINMDMLQGGMTMSYSSSTKEEDLDQMGKMMKQQLDPMMKAVIYTKMNTQGETIATKVEPAVMGMEQFTKQSGSISFPKDKVSVGTTWSNEVDDQGVKMITNYTVSKIEAETVFLDISGTVSGAGQGTISGIAEIDVQTGTPKKSEVNINISAGGNDVSIISKTTMDKI